VVLQDLDGDYLVGSLIPAFDYLAESTTTFKKEI